MSKNLYPPLGYYFSVELEGDPDSENSFLDAKGLSMEMEVESLYEGGENRYAHKLPKGVKYGQNLDLSRGLIPKSSIFGKWCIDHFTTGLTGVTRNHKIDVRDLVVHLLDASAVDKTGKAAGATPLMSWGVVRAYPVKWAINSFEAKKSELVIESLSLAYAYFYVIK